jgi:hypothetical protein
MCVQRIKCAYEGKAKAQVCVSKQDLESLK